MTQGFEEKSEFREAVVLGSGRVIGPGICEDPLDTTKGLGETEDGQY